jgi:hypothetical protein
MRVVAQLARAAHHLRRRARVDAETLARVVADPRVPEEHRPVPFAELEQTFADGDLERAMHVCDTSQQRVDQPRRFAVKDAASLVWRGQR